MTQDLLRQDKIIRQEADDLLESNGLRNLLEEYGIPHVVGSYALHLMTWRDLDIYLEQQEFSEELHFQLGGRIASCLAPVKMSFRNERIAQTPNLPFGLYWGIYLGNERKGAWKIDIWAIDSYECEQRLQFTEEILALLTPSLRMKILCIKAECWQDPGYRKIYTSQDIYHAVIEEGIEDVDGFKRYMESKGVSVG